MAFNRAGMAPRTMPCDRKQIMTRKHKPIVLHERKPILL